MQNAGLHRIPGGDEGISLHGQSLPDEPGHSREAGCEGVAVTAGVASVHSKDTGPGLWDDGHAAAAADQDSAATTTTAAAVVLPPPAAATAALSVTAPSLPVAAAEGAHEFRGRTSRNKISILSLDVTVYFSLLYTTS